MRIQEIMSQPAITCGENDTLHTAARLMWEHDCGTIPVTGRDGNVVGIVTDRDVCMATYTTGRAPQSIRVADAMSDQVFCCQAEDSLEAAEILMREKQIRRLPVVDDQSRPVGVLSLNDVARVAEERRREPIDREVIRTIAEIGRGRPTGQLAARR